MIRLPGVATCATLLASHAASAAEPPRPLLAWPAGPLEVRVAFDGPLDPSAARRLVGGSIPFRPRPRAEDAPQPAESTPRGSLRIAAASLEDDGRTLALVTDPHSWDAVYTLSLAGLRAPVAGGTATVEYGLSGVEARWTAEGADIPAWSGWWPHLDPEIVRTSTAGSATHLRSLDLLAKPGRLELTTLVRLPSGATSLRLLTSGAIEEASLNFEPGSIADDGRRAEFAVESDGEPVELALVVRTGEGDGPFTLRAVSLIDDAPAEMPLGDGQLTLAWAPPPPSVPSSPAPAPPDLTGGDAMRGEAVFFGEESRCSACHAFRGRGGVVGPDLSELSRRDLADVYRDIAEPSAVLHPEYVSYTVVLDDGRILSGVVRAVDARTIRVLDTNAQETRVARSDVEEMRPSATSIMPVGLSGALGERKMKDLLTFLTAEPQ